MLTPTLWPAIRGSPRRFAHRPPPSMMMAMCAGILGVDRESAPIPRSESPGASASSIFTALIPTVHRGAKWWRLQSAPKRELKFGGTLVNCNEGSRNTPTVTVLGLITTAADTLSFDPFAFPGEGCRSGWHPHPLSPYFSRSPFLRSCSRWLWPQASAFRITPSGWPRAAIPLVMFLGWTLVALGVLARSGFGLPSIRKMVVVYWMLLIVYSSIRTIAEAKWLVLAWIGVGIDRQRAAAWFNMRPMSPMRVPRTRISTTSTSLTAYVVS